MDNNLNSNITVYLNLEGQADNTYVNYFIYDYNDASTVLYPGRVYHQEGSDVVELYLNDIVENFTNYITNQNDTTKTNDWYKWFTFYNLANSEEDDFGKFGLQLTIHDANDNNILCWDYGDTSERDYVDVELWHRPTFHHLKDYNYDNGKFSRIAKLQGAYMDDNGIIRYVLTPTIPYNYGQYTQLFYDGFYDSSNSTQLYTYLSDGGNNYYQFMNINGYTIGNTLGVYPSIVFNAIEEDESYLSFKPLEIRTSITKGLKTAAGDETAVIAKYDTCGSKYYLKWFDRMGGIQMQPFNKGYSLNTEYDKTQITNLRDITRDIIVTTENTITINTGFLSDEVLPYYESIFVSPYLCLVEYDKDNDTFTNYQVLLTDKKFEYKTFQNQNRKMFNLELNLKLAQKETIIY